MYWCIFGWRGLWALQGRRRGHACVHRLGERDGGASNHAGGTGQLINVDVQVEVDLTNAPQQPETVSAMAAPAGAVGTPGQSQQPFLFGFLSTK